MRGGADRRQKRGSCSSCSVGGNSYARARSCCCVTGMLLQMMNGMRVGQRGEVLLGVVHVVGLGVAVVDVVVVVVDVVVVVVVLALMVRVVVAVGARHVAVDKFVT